MRNLFDNFYMSGRITAAQKRPLHDGHKRAKIFMKSHLMWQLFVENDDLSMSLNFNLSLSLTWLDCFQIDSGDFILFAEINQILLKIYFIPIILTFYVSSSTLSGNWVVNHLKSSQTQTQNIFVTENCSTHFFMTIWKWRFDLIIQFGLWGLRNCST